MDLEGQSQVIEVVNSHGADGMAVLLGAPDTAAAEIFALTLTEGDPTYAGPLTGVALGLPVFHILEPEVKAQVAPDVYEQQVGIMESVLEADRIVPVVQSVRRRLLGTDN